MYSFATISPEGYPTLEWYLEDGTLAATSVRPPAGPETEIWDHYAEDGQTVGRSLKVGTGYGHYSPEGELIEETPALAGFWELCDLKRVPAARPAGEMPAPQAERRASAIPTSEGRTVVARIRWNTPLALVAVLAVLGVVSGFAILTAPLPGWSSGQVTLQHAVPAPAPVAGASVPLPAPPATQVVQDAQPSRRPRPDPEPDVHPPVDRPLVPPPTAPSASPPPAGPQDDRTAILACLQAEHSGPWARRFKTEHLDLAGAWACAVISGVDAAGRPTTEPLSNLLRKDAGGAWKIVSYIKTWQPPRDTDPEVDDAMAFSRADTQQGILRQYPDFPASIFPRPVGPVVPTEEVIRTMAREMLELEQARNLPAFMTYYAQEVSSQSLTNAPRDTLRQQKQLAFQLWPVARYEVAGEIEVTEVEPGVWQAALVSSFQLENNSGETNAGRRRLELTFTLLHDRYQVTAERWDMLPVMDKKERIRQFVVRNRMLENKQALDDLMPGYAEEVEYFDKGTLTRDEIRRDKERYFERWPVAVQTITSPVEVEALGVARYRVTYDTQFQVRHPVEGRAREGVCQCELVIVDLPGGPHIVYERAPVKSSGPVPVQPVGNPGRSGSEPAPRPRPAGGGTPRKESFEEMTRRLNKL